MLEHRWLPHHGKRWLAVWDGPGGREQTKAFARKVDADRHGTAMEADQLRGVYVDQRRGTMLARDYGEQKFLRSAVHLRPNSASTYGHTGGRRSATGRSGRCPGRT